ncbi:FAD-dependent oxidoreductase [Bacillus spongiae]|uniref:Dihydrolipoyl dehydrogenase n=1 Tax=Bacillus spongiae TaxID=2683610 RepID=A0ABU8HIN7_9BACI
MVVGEIAEEKELVIIGGGPGGYHAAIRAAQLGIQVTLIEKKELGGVCLNDGCIPSKALTTLAKRTEDWKHGKEMGLESKEPIINLKTFQTYKNKLIKQLQKGVEGLCKANKIEVIKGNAAFLSEDRVGVEAGHDFQVFKFHHCIIATGAGLEQESWIPAGHRNVFNSYTIFTLEDIPAHIILYGQDYITLELAFSLKALGSQVTLVTQEEFDLDETVRKELKRSLKKKKIKHFSRYQAIGFQEEEKLLQIQLQDSSGERITVEGTHLYASGTKKPNIAGIGIDRLNIKTQAGYIEVDQECCTSISSIYAIGDVTSGEKLAVKAIKQGKVAAQSIHGLKPEYDERYLPKVIHTLPPIASVGLTEEIAKEHYDVVSSTYPLTGTGYAAILGEKQGTVKVIKEKGTDLLLGVHMIGAGAVELISSATIGLEMVAREEDLLYPFYPHPSMNEGLLEAIEGLEGKAIHAMPKKQSARVNV